MLNAVLFFKIKLSVSFEESSLQRCIFQISVEMVKPFGCKKQFCILQLPISYCVSLIMVYILKTKPFSDVKFAMDYKKNMSFLVIAKSPKVWKKLNRKDWAPLMQVHSLNNKLSITLKKLRRKKCWKFESITLVFKYFFYWCKYSFY